MAQAATASAPGPAGKIYKSDNIRHLSRMELAHTVCELLGWTQATAGLQVQVALKHPKVRAFANALGTPPRAFCRKPTGSEIALSRAITAP